MKPISELKAGTPKGQDRTQVRHFTQYSVSTLAVTAESLISDLAKKVVAREAAACALAIQHGVLPPTINDQTPDPEGDLDYGPNEAREIKVDAAISNSLGFGRHNTCLALRRLSG